jgi:hypothetical protein
MTTKTILRYEPEEELELWLERLDSGGQGTPDALLRAILGDFWTVGAYPTHHARPHLLHKLGLSEDDRVTTTYVQVMINGVPVTPSKLIKQAAKAAKVESLHQFLVENLSELQRPPISADYLFRTADGKRVCVGKTPIDFEALDVKPSDRIYGCRVWSQDVKLSREFARDVSARKAGTWVEIGRNPLGTPLTACWSPGSSTPLERGVDAQLQMQLEGERQALRKRALAEATAEFNATTH